MADSCGPGVSDNGAGLAALLAVARAWKNCPMPADLSANPLLVANVGEEGEGNLLGMRHLAKQSLARKIRAFLVLDGADTDHITSRALGSRRFEISFTGPGGHSWSDYGVGNPLHALCRAVALFAETRIDGAPKSAVNVGLIEGGSSVNAIPQMARAKVDIRSETNEKIDELVDLLGAAVDRAREVENQRATGGKVAAKLKEIGSRPAAALPENAPILQYVRAVDAHLGIRSHLDCSSTDANIPMSLGIPAIAIGGGGVGGGVHTTQEWFRPEGRDLGLKRIFLTLLLLMRDPGLVGAGSANPSRIPSEPPPGGSGPGPQHRGLGRHVRPGESGAARRLAPPVPGAAVLPGHRGASGAVPRVRMGALHLEGSGRGGACRRLPLLRLSIPNAGVAAHHGAQVGLHHGLDVGDGTFARGARLSEQAPGFRGGWGAGGHGRAGPDDARGRGAAGSISRGDLLTFFCAIGFAAHIVTLGHFSEHMRFQLLSIAQVGAAAVLALSLFWWAETPHVRWRPAVICAILMTGLLATALAFTIQAWAQQYTTSTRTGLIYMLEPVFAWITSYCIVGEGLSGRAAAGAALILGGVVLVELKPLNPRLHPSG